GEEDNLDGLRTGGVRVDIDNDNIVQDAAGGTGIWLLVYLQIAEPEEMVDGRTIQLETRILHTERNGTYDKVADSNQWVLATNHRPVPSFTLEPDSDLTYEQVIQFSGTATDEDDDEIASWRWDFGDVNTASVQNPTHQYPNGGTFEVTLTVTDERGVTGEVPKEIEVEGPPNEVPVIDEITADPDDPAVDTDIDFVAEITDSDQPTGTAFTYLWQFGDAADSTSTVAAPTFSYDTAGAYTVTLTITDAQDATDTATIEVSVGNENPTIGGLTATPTEPTTGDAVEFEATNVSDVDDDAIDRFEWDFGDGSIDDDGDQEIVHIYAAPGTYTVSVVAEDVRGGRSEAETLEITVEGPERVVMRAYPNPAATTATIKYFLPTGATDAELWIFDLNRSQILLQTLAAGATEFEWDLRDDAGNPVPNGLYFCMITAASPTNPSDVFRLLVAR
ncbi:PKD domain-containing protein, partial [Candidatus Bipolaricaulota bacterium]|nr:PKD domain-containing protein [Candidatus Bipolaricaulota bacterium]